VVVVVVVGQFENYLRAEGGLKSAFDKQKAYSSG
jgi:hypothetical protein